MRSEYLAIRQKRGKVIELFRKARGMTRTELGLRCGYKNHPYLVVYKWEKGINPLPTEKVRTMCAALHMYLYVPFATEKQYDEWLENSPAPCEQCSLKPQRCPGCPALVLHTPGSPQP